MIDNIMKIRLGMGGRSMEGSMEKDILTRLAEVGEGYSKGQRRIASYILENYDKAAFMTAEKLGRTVGVSESTVVRFASDLGYDGYPDMRKAVQEMIRSRLTSVQRIEVAKQLLDEKNILKSVLVGDAERLQAMLRECDPASFDAAVDAIAGAQHVYILGMRSSACLAGFLGYYLGLLMDNISLIHDQSSCELYEQLMRIHKGDVFVGISYPRYSTRSVKALRYAKSRGALAIGITDSDASPFAPLADILLCAKSDMVSFLDSLVAPMSLLNALIVALGAKNRDTVEDTFRDLEKIWADYDVYARAKD